VNFTSIGKIFAYNTLPISCSLAVMGFDRSAAGSIAVAAGTADQDVLERISYLIGATAPYIGQKKE